MQLKKLFHLDVIGKKSDCENRTDSKSRFDQKSTWRFWGLASSHFRNEKKFAGTSDWSGQISPALIQCLRWCKTGWAACTPCIWNEIGGSEKIINHEGDRMQHMQTAAEHRGFTSFQMVHTHTHTYLATWTCGDMDLHFAWHAWHLWHWTGSLRGSNELMAWAGSSGALGSRLAPWSPPLLAWQAWHLVTSTVTCWLRWRACVSFGAVVAAAVCVVTLRGRRGTLWHGSSLCVACVARSGGALVSRLAPWSPPPFAWQAWHLVTSTFTLGGRRGTSRHGSSLCVAGLALMALDWLLACLGLVWRHGPRRCLRGRRGTWRHRPSLCVAWRHGPSLCVACVALRDMDRHFAWQAWHLWHWAGSGGALGSRLAPWSLPPFAWQAWYLATSTVTLRGRRGTLRHGSSLCVAGVALLALGWLRWRAWVSFGAVVAAVCVAGVALCDMDRHFAWQAWHLWYWAGPQTTCPHTTCPHTTYSYTTYSHTTCPHTTRLSCHCLILFCLGNSYTYPSTHDTCT